MSRRMFQPSKQTVLDRWAFNLGPQRTVVDMLTHLGDKAIFTPFAPGDEPYWLEALAVLMAHNPQFTLEEVVLELSRRVNEPAKAERRKRQDGDIERKAP